jgi:hypothetical protein
MNLTKSDITIVDYKKSLAKRSEHCGVTLEPMGWISLTVPRSSTDREGQAHLQDGVQGCHLSVAALPAFC